MADAKIANARSNGFWLFGILGVAFFAWNYPYTRRLVVCSPTRSIYTVDEAYPRVECISVVGSQITETGNFSDLTNTNTLIPLTLVPYIPTWIPGFLQWSLEVITIPPTSVVVPGLADSHAHVIQNGFKMQLELEKAKSVSDVIDLIKTYILSHPDVERDPTRWIQGMGWDQTKWPGGEFPTAEDLSKDPLLSGRPIALYRVDVHATWVSTRVLELIGDDMPSEVEGGIIVRDSEGRPTGVFLDNAMSIVPHPKFSEAELSNFFDITMKMALQYGLTSVHDAAAEPEVIEFLMKQAETGTLPIRLYLMGSVSSDEYWGPQLPRLINYGKDGRLNLRSVKLFTDGALGSWGAALLAPYSDKPETSGIMRIQQETLSKLVHQFHRDDWQVNIHCIGDKANNVVLDVLEDVILERNGSRKADITKWRPRIEHSQILTLNDIERVGRLGVIPSVQPTHATSDMWYAEKRLGPDRMKGAYAYQSLLKASPGNVLPLGSDFPVEGVNPLLGFYAAVSRLSVDGTSPHGPDGWYPEQKLTRAQALKGMTLDAAYASFAETDLGSLVPGKKADFVVLDRDIMSIPVGEILEAKVTATVIDGKVAYGAL
ncbi:amidohydrolase family-domain-containing protein [Desarmillaria tabescens]|uniref:Amidohydrolase family-domain-containing protein n=1 Tax=Armillaria tabescens TaxID=1929756 RepID=A0AA39NCP2_ARMTA|nr:amidohydrolase family-domain-containing protein [Desarmillaria tabescens]KAK0463225.1 amidohydrolase family-domain-containing protein [Desarmillaria tabescens]